MKKASGELADGKLVGWKLVQGSRNFPAGRHDDEADALSGAHSILSGPATGAWDSRAIALAAGTAERIEERDPVDPLAYELDMF